MTSFNLSYFLRDPISKDSHIEDQGFNIQIVGRWPNVVYNEWGPLKLEEGCGPSSYYIPLPEMLVWGLWGHS